MPSWLQLYHWLGDSRAFYAQQRALHGDVFTIRPFGVVPSVVFAHPAAVRETLGVAIVDTWLEALTACEIR